MSKEIKKYSPEEDEQILNAYNEMLEVIKVPINEDDLELLNKAYLLAKKAHEPQRRKSGEAYIFHPIAVTRICAEEIELGATSLACALLHDVVEDTSYDLEYIRNEFGEKVANIVKGLTKLDKSYDTESLQAENFRKVLMTLVEDVRVVLIKMADRMHNMRTIGSMPEHKQLKIASETSYVYARLAHRLGLYRFKTEYQDLCMKVLDNEQYKKIASLLNQTKKQREQYIVDFIKPIDEKLKTMNIPYRVFGRPKSIYSIHHKLQNKNVKFEEIHDLLAIRIILDVESKELEERKCWDVYSVVTNIHQVIPNRLKDWINTPKANGYQSIHNTLIGPGGNHVEIQIRTERMDQIAEKGFAAHWKYKNVSNAPNAFDNWIDNIRDILENKDASAFEFLSDFQSDLFNEEIYVYTPKGDMKILPKDSSALDFAFSIHSDVGANCTSININGKIAPLNQTLQNGDRVKIITNKNQKPKKEWLSYVKTGKARAKIRQALKEDSQKHAALGKEMLERKLKALKTPFEENINTLQKHFKCTSRLEFYNNIGEQIINLAEIGKNFDVDSKTNLLVLKVDENTPKPQKEPSSQPNIQPTSSNSLETYTNEILINGEDATNIDYHMASCCHPISGDKIFAYTTNSKGLSIHRHNCKNAVNLLANFAHRTLNAEWIKENDFEHEVEFKIMGIDKGKGVITEISETISNKLDMDMVSLNISSDAKRAGFEATIKLLVKNKEQTNLIINTLTELNSVSTVERLD